MSFHTINSHLTKYSITSIISILLSEFKQLKNMIEFTDDSVKLPYSFIDKINSKEFYESLICHFSFTFNTIIFPNAESTNKIYRLQNYFNYIPHKLFYSKEYANLYLIYFGTDSRNFEFRKIDGTITKNFILTNGMGLYVDHLLLNDYTISVLKGNENCKESYVLEFYGLNYNFKLDKKEFIVNIQNMYVHTIYVNNYILDIATTLQNEQI